MKIILLKICFIGVAFLIWGACSPSKVSLEESGSLELIIPPKDLFRQLFYDVLKNDSLFGAGKVFADSKDFMDCTPKGNMDSILRAYSVLEEKENIKIIEAFIKKNFYLPSSKNISEFPDSSDINLHISKLWKVLKRDADRDSNASTLIPLKYDYIVPGGRFREIYYWDSYFTMLGLFADKETELAECMIKNFSDIINRVGFIPNGNRSYYISRSQPPFFSYMVEALLDYTKSDTTVILYLDAMQKEYDFWMQGSERLIESNNAELHCVMMPDGEILNRYYDKYDIPREEMYRNDVETAYQLSRVNSDFDEKHLFRNLRSGAESGWDFSSRWLKDYDNLYSIHTIDIIPVDLNSLLYHLELMLGNAYSAKGEKEKAALYRDCAEKRKRAILKYLWSNDTHFFMDYDFVKKVHTGNFSLAGVYPLYVGIANQKQASYVAAKVKGDFLKQGGVVTTLYKTGQQWDFPNGWAPLQWVTFIAMDNYGYNKIADEIKDRWMKMVENVYLKTGKLLEKYDVVNVSDTGGGEYSNQDGFGWTNGIYRAFSVFN